MKIKWGNGKRMLYLSKNRWPSKWGNNEERCFIWLWRQIVIFYWPNFWIVKRKWFAVAQYCSRKKVKRRNLNLGIFSNIPSWWFILASCVMINSTNKVEENAENPFGFISWFMGLSSMMVVTFVISKTVLGINSIYTMCMWCDIVRQYQEIHAQKKNTRYCREFLHK